MFDECPCWASNNITIHKSNKNINSNEPEINSKQPTTTKSYRPLFSIYSPSLFLDLLRLDAATLPNLDDPLTSTHHQQTKKSPRAINPTDTYNHQ